MANLIYTSFKQSLLSQSPSVDLDTDAIKVALVRGYTPSAAHQFLSDVTGAGGGTVVASGLLLNRSVAGGVFDADDLTLSAVPTGAACAHLILFKDTGTANTSPLIEAIDTATGLPFTPNGGDLQITWDNGTNRIFKLG